MKLRSLVGIASDDWAAVVAWGLSLGAGEHAHPPRTATTAPRTPAPTRHAFIDRLAQRHRKVGAAVVIGQRQRLLKDVLHRQLVDLPVFDKPQPRTKHAAHLAARYLFFLRRIWSEPR